MRFLSDICTINVELDDQMRAARVRMYLGAVLVAVHKAVDDILHQLGRRRYFPTRVKETESSSENVSSLTFFKWNSQY